MKKNLTKASLLLASFGLIASNCGGAVESSIYNAKVLFAESYVLNVYNWEDYILEGEEEGELGLVEQFEEYCLDELGMDVTVNYSCFDTNETMLSQLKTGSVSYDLVCPSDYTIQKMIREGLVIPYDEGSTPNYDTYVSPYISEKIESIQVDGVNVSDYARGYMWGTLGLLYNPGFSTVQTKGIEETEMDEDMLSWDSLWDDKYYNMLAIKDSMRDTYAVGIFYTYEDDFELDGVEYEGFNTLKEKYESGEYDADEYNEKLTEVFNLCDDDTLSRVQGNLTSLKNNAYGFEVDSGKVDMANGRNFAINVAWSGDAAYAMDMADEVNEYYADDEDYEPTILKYALPETGANIWFDGWVMPTTCKNKELAQEFVDFLSRPENAAANMEYIGYTPVIAGDAILDLVLSWYDVRYNEDTEEIDESILEELEEVESADISYLTDEEKESSYYVKDITYFFEGTLEEHEIDDAYFCILASEKGRQFDTQYPDSSVLPRLAVMADFGDQNDKLLSMWEEVKNTNLPLWAYILLIVVVVALIALYVVYKVRKRRILNKRKAMKHEAEEKETKKAALRKSANGEN